MGFNDQPPSKQIGYFAILFLTGFSSPPARPWPRLQATFLGAQSDIACCAGLLLPAFVRNPIAPRPVAYPPAVTVKQPF
jgi:hypothetical protein